jgi:hypothetical protein
MPTHSPGPVSSAATPVAGVPLGDGDEDVAGDGDPDGVVLGDPDGLVLGEGDVEATGEGSGLALGDGVELASTEGEGLGEPAGSSSARATEPTLNCPIRNMPTIDPEISLCSFICSFPLPL